MIHIIGPMKSISHFFISLMVAFGLAAGGRILCDADSDCFYAPVDSDTSGYYPALLVLSCTGATAEDLDSIIYVADSLRILVATCHESRNHRESYLNDQDIMKTYEKLVCSFKVDLSRVFIYGFSGMGVQALLSLFLHGQHFRGVVAVSAHKGAMGYLKGEESSGRCIYLISRENDWNLDDNRQMHVQFGYYDLNDTLVITPGEHMPPSQKELLDACQWLLSKTSAE
jgi:hypothetical protein